VWGWVLDGLYGEENLWSSVVVNNERVKFKQNFDEALKRVLSEQNDPDKMCGQDLTDCVIDDKNKIESLTDPDGVEWIMYQCLYCKRAFVVKD